MSTQVPIVLERALLRIIADHGSMSWRRIASHLSNLDVPRDPDMLVALKRMLEDGSLHRVGVERSAEDVWSITEVGRTRLAAAESIVPTSDYGAMLVMARMVDSLDRVDPKVVANLLAEHHSTWAWSFHAALTAAIDKRTPAELGDNASVLLDILIQLGADGMPALAKLLVKHDAKLAESLQTHIEIERYRKTKAIPQINSYAAISGNGTILFCSDSMIASVDHVAEGCYTITLNGESGDCLFTVEVPSTSYFASLEIHHPKHVRVRIHSDANTGALANAAFRIVRHRMST